MTEGVRAENFIVLPDYIDRRHLIYYRAREPSCKFSI
jgi:hypothetical protein